MYMLCSRSNNIYRSYWLNMQGQLDEALKKFQDLVNENPRDFRPYLCQVILFPIIGIRLEFSRLVVKLLYPVMIHGRQQLYLSCIQDKRCNSISLAYLVSLSILYSFFSSIASLCSQFFPSLSQLLQIHEQGDLTYCVISVSNW